MNSEPDTSRGSLVIDDDDDDNNDDNTTTTNTCATSSPSTAPTIRSSRYLPPNYFFKHNDDNDNDDDDSWKSRALAHLQHHWKIIVLGQLLSLLLASGGAAQATLHFECDLSSPTFTMALVYLGLSSNLIWIWMRQRRTTTTTTRSSSIINNGEAEEVQNDGIIRTTSSGGGNDARSDINNNILGEQQDFSNNPWDLPSTTTAEFTLFGIIKTNRPPWQYFLIAFLDVQANAATMLAFKYTTLTSVSLFDALAIPSAMVLSRCFFGRQYTWIHILGVVTSMTGVVFNVMQDYESDQAEDKNFPHKMRGDILAIAGGLMYGLTNTLTEVTVRHNNNNNNNNNGNNTTEYLGLMGFFGFCVAFIQSLLFEFNDILEFFGRDPDQEATCSLAMGWWLYFVFVAVNLASYMGAAHFLTISEAAYFSLSLLTGDLWSVVFSIVAEHIVPQPLFFLALIFVLSGVVLYEMAPSPVQSDNNEQQEQRRASVPIPGHDGLFNNSSEDDEDDTQQEYNAAIL